MKRQQRIARNGPIDAEFMDINTYNKIIERSAASSGKRPAYRIYHGRV